MLLGRGRNSRRRASVWLEQAASHCNEAVFTCKAIFSFLRIGVLTVVQVRDRFEPRFDESGFWRTRFDEMQPGFATMLNVRPECYY
jgi:hypothetical protein